MNKLIIIFLCMITLRTHGQSDVFYLGVTGGFSLASLGGNDITNEYQDTRIGYSGGVFGQFNFKKIISVRTECYYERKGSSWAIQATDQTGIPIGMINGRENFDYLTVPLLLRATFGKKISWFINAGPYIGFLIKEIQRTEPFQNFLVHDFDNTDDFKKTEMGISAGTGVSYTATPKLILSLEIRDNLGITGISRKPAVNGEAVKSNSLNFLCGIAYKIEQRNSILK